MFDKLTSIEVVNVLPYYGWKIGGRRLVLTLCWWLSEVYDYYGEKLLEDVEIENGLKFEKDQSQMSGFGHDFIDEKWLSIIPGISENNNYPIP